MLFVCTVPYEVLVFSIISSSLLCGERLRPQFFCSSNKYEVYFISILSSLLALLFFPFFHHHPHLFVSVKTRPSLFFFK